MFQVKTDSQIYTQQSNSTNLKEGRLGPFLTKAVDLGSGVLRARDLGRLFSGTTGGRGGSNTADNLLADQDGNEFTTSSNGSFLSSSDST